jgi:HEAT repeat protein
MDHAEGMTRILFWPAFSSLPALALATTFAGCGLAPSGPNRHIATSPEGRPKVYLTSAEAAAAAREPAPLSSGVIAQAVFAAPLGGPPPLKPFSEWTEQDAAADALGRIGPAAIPALIGALGSPDASVRLKAIDVLGRMGSDAKDAVPQLLKLLDDPDETVRKAATRTLGRIGPEAQAAVPALVQTLLQPN